MKEPITWTENWQRIRNLFMQVKRNQIRIHTIQGELRVTPFPNEDPEELADKIAKAIAGKSVAMEEMEKIINTI